MANTFESGTFESGEELGYRSVSVKAVVGLALAFLSPLALIHPALWVAPALAAGVSLWALWDIAREPERWAGRGTALAALGLALFVGAAAGGQYYARRAMSVSEARETIDLWFNELRHDEPHRAHQLALPPDERFPLDEEDLWEAYRSVPKVSTELKQFVARPEIKALLALGEQAHVRLYSVEGYAESRQGDGVKTIYAVTYLDHDKPKTFFIEVTAVRPAKPVEGQNPWYVAHIEGGVQPRGW